jgi:hypothetical protein
MDSPGKESSRPGEGATTKASNGFAYDRIVKRVGGIELRAMIGAAGYAVLQIGGLI